MAWLYKRSNSPFYWIGYRVGDRQYLKSTKRRDEVEARMVLAQFNAMDQARQAGSLTEQFYRSLTGAVLPTVALKTALAEWLKECDGTGAAGTHQRYAHAADQFQAYLKATDTGPLLREVSASEIQAFLNAFRATHAVGTVNLTRKILSVFFNWCVQASKLTSNPVKATKRMKGSKFEQVKRRAFSVAEMKTMLAQAPDGFWRFMLLGGVYTGLRLGDLICLRRGEVDLGQNVIRLDTIKTDTTVEIPLAPLFRAEVEQRLAQGNGEYLWPDQARHYQKYGSSPFSNEFYDTVLVPCKLAPPREDKQAHKRGRGHKRTMNAVSFHSLRHTFVSLLKTSGVSQHVAKALAGHASDTVSDLYTHIGPEHMRAAIALLPEVTK
jgi:integrase